MYQKKLTTMGQKVHPVGFRLGITQNHLSQWFAQKKKYSKYLCEDDFLRKKLQQQFENARLEKIEISRKIEGDLALVIYAEIPEIIVGPKGQNLKKLQQNIKQTIEKYRQSKLFQATFGSNKPQYIQSLDNFQKKKSKDQAHKMTNSIVDPQIQSNMKVTLHISGG